jgi:hypothetical protein
MRPEVRMARRIEGSSDIGSDDRAARRQRSCWGRIAVTATVRVCKNQELRTVADTAIDPKASSTPRGKIGRFCP